METKMDEIARIELDGKIIEIPIITGTENEKALDISKLRAQTGYITIDRGFKNTGSCMSAITFLDGEKGILRYRGYPIEQLAEEASFLEVSYLILNGELPSKVELEAFERDIDHHTLVHEDMKRFFEAYPAQAHPMGILASMIVSMSTFYPESQDPNRSEEAFQLSINRLIAKLPTLAAMVYKNAVRHPFMYPKNDLGYIENFMHMCFAMPTEDYTPNPVIAKALNKLFILHADHEQNCSASTVRIVGSSQANLYASISAGISALWGPLHGGANQAVIEMLEMIQADGGDLDKWIDKAKDKEDPFRLMGFGHRVYKNFDPRATIIKKACDDILEQLGVDDPTLAIAKRLEKVALEDEYFKSRGLYPNVDFYSGIIYKAIGIPTEMFTVMFALGRLPGWIAQWKEMLDNGDPIGRPRQVYTGKNARDFVDISKR
ncbi:MAG: citrate synthase [Arenicella sp.]|jgi:citrate synthase